MDALISLYSTGGGGGGSYGVTTLTDNGAVNKNDGMVIITFLSTSSPDIQEDPFIIKQRETLLKIEKQLKQFIIQRRTEIQNTIQSDRAAYVEKWDTSFQYYAELRRNIKLKI